MRQARTMPGLRAGGRRACRAAMLLAVALALLDGCRREHGAVAPSFERMLAQPRYEPYGQSAFFPDGRAMRIPPEGTVSHEAIVESGPVATGDVEGAPAVSIPLHVGDELLATGQSRFGIYCAVCHGALGDGNSVVGHNMVECPPPSLLSPVVRALPAGTLYHVITNGFGRMPSYASQLSARERWAVVAYVHRLQRAAPVSDSGRAGGRNAAGCGPRT